MLVADERVRRFAVRRDRKSIADAACAHLRNLNQVRGVNDATACALVPTPVAF